MCLGTAFLCRLCKAFCELRYGKTAVISPAGNAAFHCMPAHMAFLCRDQFCCYRNSHKRMPDADQPVILQGKAFTVSSDKHMLIDDKRQHAVRRCLFNCIVASGRGESEPCAVDELPVFFRELSVTVLFHNCRCICIYLSVLHTLHQ